MVKTAGWSRVHFPKEDPMKVLRKIIEIDEELCDGCGQCVPSCAEGALEIIDGKARVVRDMYCDGLGACLGECPTGALRIIEREAEEFDEEAAMAYVASKQQADAGAAAPHAAPRGGCPGAGMATFVPAAAQSGEAEDSPSQLGHWPVQIKLSPPDAPFLRGKHLVLAADCTAVAHPDFHRTFVGGNAVLMGCPKFDGDYAERLAALFKFSGITGVSVVRMEVPCCTGLAEAARRAHAACGRDDLPIKEVIVGRQGRVIEPGPALKTL